MERGGAQLACNRGCEGERRSALERHALMCSRKPLAKWRRSGYAEYPQVLAVIAAKTWGYSASCCGLGRRSEMWECCRRGTFGHSCQRGAQLSAASEMPALSARCGYDQPVGRGVSIRSRDSPPDGTGTRKLQREQSCGEIWRQPREVTMDGAISAVTSSKKF